MVGVSSQRTRAGQVAPNGSGKVKKQAEVNPESESCHLNFLQPETRQNKTKPKSPLYFWFPLVFVANMPHSTSPCDLSWPGSRGPSYCRPGQRGPARADPRPAGNQPFTGLSQRRLLPKNLSKETQSPRSAGGGFQGGKFLLWSGLQLAKGQAVGRPEG